MNQRANRSVYRNYQKKKYLSSNEECSDGKSTHIFPQCPKLKGDQSTSGSGCRYQQLKIKSLMILGK